MKFLVLFLALLFSEFIVKSEPPTQQTTKVYVIHKEKRHFVRKPVRRYLKHKIRKHNRIQNHRERIHVAPRHK